MHLLNQTDNSTNYYNYTANHQPGLRKERPQDVLHNLQISVIAKIVFSSTFRQCEGS